MRCLVLLLLLVASPVLAQDSPLVGTWKLESFQSILDNDPPIYPLGARPKGSLMFTREGRIMVVITAEGRTAGTSDAERATLHKTMFAYSGKYRVEGKELITTVELSWNEAWNGTEQRRYYRIEAGKLFVETAPAPSLNFPGKTGVGRFVFVRDQ